MSRKVLKSSKPWTKNQWIGFVFLVIAVVVVFGFIIPVSK